MGRNILAAIATCVLIGVSASAHHGYANFHLDRSQTIEGRLTAVRFVNPHVVLTLEAADSTVYTATWNAASQVQRAGVTSSTLKIGDRLVVTGAPPRDAAARELMPVWEIRRPADGWVWSRPTRPR